MEEFFQEPVIEFSIISSISTLTEKHPCTVSIQKSLQNEAVKMIRGIVIEAAGKL